MDVGSGPIAGGKDDGEEAVAVVFDRVRSFRLAYLDIARGSATVRWQPEWLDRPGLPALVEVDIQLTSGERILDTIELKLR
jgi:hypothetical protein